MNKIAAIIFVVYMLSLINVRSVYSDSKVDVVVAGYINHGPMQPTITAIKEVTSKYGDQISVTWIDLETVEGQKYFQEHGLSAHLNILINGVYQYTLNGKTITFQWFEGDSWTKDDLDAVISNLLNNTGNAVPVKTANVGAASANPLQIGSINFYIVVAIAILVVVLVCVFVIRKIKRR